MDPALWELLKTGGNEDAEEVEAIIRLDDPRVKIAGVRIVSRFGPIATCRLRKKSIIETRAEENVRSLKAPRLLGPEVEPEGLNARLRLPPAVLPSDVRRPPGLSLTGTGVVVGIIDWGCDFDHPQFKHPDGSTRLLTLWDQRGSPPPQARSYYGYGTVHSNRRINRALASANPYRALGYHPADADSDGHGAHGTHVMDIAAGNGLGRGPMGMAPEADLIFVHLADRGTGGLANLGDSVRILEALDFVAKVAGPRPWVVNFSVGRHGGPHDGTTLAEMAFDFALQDASNCFLVQSTGNYSGKNIHSSGRLQTGQTRTLSLIVDEADTTPNELEIWYSGGDEFAVRIESPNGAISRWVKLGEQADVLENGRIVGRIYHRASDPNNSDNHLDLFLYVSAPPGVWKVSLKAERISSGGVFHTWLERDEACPGCQTRFSKFDSDNFYTTGTLANSRIPLVIGAYNTHSPTREVAAFSSVGPTRDHRPKPDLCAPGEGVLAARSSPRGASKSPGMFVRKSGTSMAAPHVTGAVALCLQGARRPLWSHEIRELILNNTEPAPASGRGALRYGHGYLDVGRVVEAVLALPPRRKIAPVYSYAASEEHPFRSKERTMNGRRDEYFDRLEQVIKGTTSHAASERNLLAEILRASGVPLDSNAIDPDKLYQMLAFNRNGSLPAQIGESLTVLARPGEAPTGFPQAGDVLLRVALGEPGLGHVAVISDPTLWSHKQLANAPFQPESQQPGFYATVIEGGAFPHTHADRFARRILDAEGRLPFGQLLLRPRLAINNESGVEKTSFSSLNGSLADELEMESNLMPNPSQLETDDAFPEFAGYNWPLNSLSPPPIPVGSAQPLMVKNIPFAATPPMGSYWPVLTRHPVGRLVSYQPQTGKIVSAQGYWGRHFLADRDKGARWHIAVDLFAYRGDQIVACEDGRIVDFLYFYDSACGEDTYSLLIKSNLTNIVINYGEVTKDSLTANGLKKGDPVNAGQPIAFVSSTNMLHFSAYTANTTSNPRWMKSQANPPANLLNPTKYLLFLQEHGKGVTGFRFAFTAAPQGKDWTNAIHNNCKHANNLGWKHYRQQINDLLAPPFRGLRVPIDEIMLAEGIYLLQQALGLDADGELGPKTWEKIKPYVLKSGSSLQSTAKPAAKEDFESNAESPLFTSIDENSRPSAPILISRDSSVPGLTLYVKIPLGNNIPDKTGIFIPQTFDNKKPFDLVVYLHGNKSWYPGKGKDIQQYWDGSKHPFFALREEVNLSSRNVVFVAPSLGDDPQSETGHGSLVRKFDEYIDNVLAAFNSHYLNKGIENPVQLNSIVLAAHSAGGRPMRLIVNSQTSRYATQINECWGFDSLYGGVNEWAKWAGQTGKKLFTYWFDDKNKTNSTALKGKPNIFVNKASALPEAYKRMKPEATPHYWVPKLHLLGRLQGLTVPAMHVPSTKDMSLYPEQNESYDLWGQLTFDELMNSKLRDLDLSSYDQNMLTDYCLLVVMKIKEKEKDAPLSNIYDLHSYHLIGFQAKSTLDLIEEIEIVLTSRLLSTPNIEKVKQKIKELNLDIPRIKERLLRFRAFTLKHKLVPTKHDTLKHLMSSDVLASFNAIVEEVLSLTGQNIAYRLSDTFRPLEAANPKAGAGGDHFSYHKTGRAVDLDQGVLATDSDKSSLRPKWLIKEDPMGEEMYFRLYLLHKNKDAPTDNKFIVKLHKDTRSSFIDSTKFSQWNSEWSYVDVTAIAAKYGWSRIKAWSGWKSKHNLREWWHYEKRYLDGSKIPLNWYEALKMIYTEEQIENNLKQLIKKIGKTDNYRKRLKEIGVPENVLAKLFSSATSQEAFTQIQDLGNYDEIYSSEDSPPAERENVLLGMKFTTAFHWGSKAEIATSLGNIVRTAHPELVGKTLEKMTKAEKGLFKSKWIMVRTELFAARKSLVMQGLLPVLGGAEVPFGFVKVKRGNYEGLRPDTAYPLYRTERLDKTLQLLYNQGKITITQEELDLFQRIANVETSGFIQTLNTYDAGVVSIGFMQFTLHVGKIQEWIKLDEVAFRRFGIELDPVEKYTFTEGGHTEQYSAIKGVPQSRIDELRRNGWAERFYYAGLDADVIIAEVKLAKDYLQRHLKDFKARLKDNALYDNFFNNYYSNSTYVKALFQESYNNNPSKATSAIKETLQHVNVKNLAAMDDFLVKYKELLMSRYSGLVEKTATGTSLRL